MVSRPHRPVALAVGGAVSTVVGVLVPAERAEALSCGCSGATMVLAPENGATDVPVDAFLWFANSYYYVAPSEIALLTAAGEQVELERRELEVGGETLRIGIPVEALAPNTLYQAFSCDSGVCDRIITEFTTGSHTDEDAPPLPIHGEPERMFSSGLGPYSCGRLRALGLNVDHDGILVADLGDANLDVDALDVGALGGFVTAATTDSRLVVGVGLCDDIWPGDEDEALGLRLGLFDVSGNFSGWTEPERLELPRRGCSTSDETPAGWAFGLLLIAAVRRRSKASGPRSG